MIKLEREFYQQNGVEAAKKLVGKILVHNTSSGVVKGRITEAECYCGPYDKAAHSYKHKGKDGRCQVQYKEGGYAYIYLIYGMYDCFNVTCNVENEPHCVLIRALEPLEGLEIMKKNRNTEKIKNLCSGPGKLTMAMGINRSMYGEDLCGDLIYLEDDGFICDIEESKRINIDYAEEFKDYLWRFTLKGSKFLSVNKNK